MSIQRFLPISYLKTELIDMNLNRGLQTGMHPTLDQTIITFPRYDFILLFKFSFCCFS